MNSKLRRRLSPRHQSVEVLIKHDAEARSEKPGRLRKAFEAAGIFGVLLQAVMLIVVGYGVAKTVPIVQHELVRYQAEQLAQEVDEQQKRIASGERSIAELTHSLRQLELHERDLQNRAGEAERQLRIVEAELRQARWTKFVNQLGRNSHGAWIMPTRLSNLNESWDMEWTDYPLTHHSEADLYGDLLKSLHEIERRRSNRTEVPDEFITVAAAHLESRREFLECPDLFRDRLEADFRRRLNAEGADPFNVSRDFVSCSIHLVSECALKASTVVGELRQRTPP